jgi:acetolactate synthase-1/2/3 large subunit
MPGKEKKSAGQAVVEALVAEGVDLVFGLPGSHIHAICDALIDAPEIKLVVCKHENNAALMADMYGRLTGRPGVCLVTAGPGATNSMTGVAQAFAAGSPLIHVTGTVPRGADKGSFHGVDRPDFLERAFSNVTKWSVEVDELEDIPGILAEAFTVATRGRPGPVHIDFPEDLLLEPPAEVWGYERAIQSAAPDADLVERVAGALLDAAKPMICGGVAILGGGARADLVQLADWLRAPVTFPRNATDVFPSQHDLCAGAFNSYPDNPFPLRLVEQSDVLLVLGMRADTAAAELLQARAPRESIFLVPEGEIRLAQGVSISESVNCKVFLSALRDRLAGQRTGGEGWADGRVAEVRELYRRGLQRELESYRGRRPLHFGLALNELIPVLDEDALVVGDIGTHGVWASRFFELYGTQTYLEPGSWGAMGFALPAAIAGKLVDPGRQVVAITGDGAFLMSCSDFGSALEMGTKIVVVILDDHQYGMIYRLQTEDYGRTIGTELRPPDFVKFAESYGAMGIRVEDEAELRAAYTQAIDADAPVIVDVVCGYGFPHPRPAEWLEGHEM